MSKYDPVFIGLLEEDAYKLIRNHRLSFRICAKNDKTFAITQDYVSNRVNLYITNGVVVDCKYG